MNNYEILIIGITVLIGLIVFYFSISTIIETRRVAIVQYEDNKENRKKRFNEKN